MRKYLFWLLPFIWISMIYYASSQPYEQQNIQPLLTEKIDLSFIKPYVEWISFTYNTSTVSVENLGVAGFLEFMIRKGAHVFVFFVLTCLFYFTLKQTTKFSLKSRLLISFVLSFVYAGVDEYHQGFTENRTSYIGDVFLDGLGALLAVSLLMVVHNIRKKNHT